MQGRKLFHIKEIRALQVSIALFIASMNRGRLDRGFDAGPGPASDGLPVPEPTFAERARTLVYLGPIGSLSTLSRK
jgi:hypothetical protein